MNKKGRIVEVGIAGIILFTLLFYYTFIIENAHHDCSGEDCHICMMVEMVVQTISNLKFVMSNLSVFMVLLSAFTVVCSFYKRKNEIKDTLITLKVELLN